MSTTDPKSLPKFEDLPLLPHHPKFSAWGLWGENDEAGTLRLITPETVRRAAAEINEGLRFSLNWSLNSPVTPGFGRHNYPFTHTLHADAPGLLVFDDSITFNTQKSSQWDGLRHFAYQKEQLFYQGVSREQITTKGSGVLGLHNWHDQGCLAARAVLIDYWSYAQQTGKLYDPLSSYAIAFEDLMDCLKAQEKSAGSPIDILRGDVLLIRCGYTESYLTLGQEEEKAVGQVSPPQTCGVDQDERLLKWIWDHHFSAVAGDAQGFECFPPNASADFLFHEVLLAGWGCPVGEMLWLEDVAKACHERKRYTFFVSSSPLNVHGGVASPANMIAIL